MKKILLLIIFLFSFQNYSYAKLIEFEKCYNAKVGLKVRTDPTQIENVKWSQDLYKTLYTSLYYPFESSDYEKIIKYREQNIKLKDNYEINAWSGMSLEELKDFLSNIKELEKQGFYKVFPTREYFYSISTSSGIITQTTIYSEDYMRALYHIELWYNYKSEKEGEKSFPWNFKKIENQKFKIDNYTGGIIQAIQIASSNPQKIIINLKNSHVTTISGFADKQKIITQVCKPLSGLGKADDYTKYWWAVVLILAVIFFIYTQTKTEIGSGKKEKNNLFRSFLDFIKKLILRKNKVVIKEKKIEKKNSLKSENFLIKFMNGEESLAYSFWFMYTVITSINLIIAYILKVSNLLFVAGLFFIFQWCYFIFATIGTWKSATNYKINKESKNEGAGWATAVYIYLVISLITSIFRTIKSFG